MENKTLKVKGGFLITRATWVAINHLVDIKDIDVDAKLALVKAYRALEQQAKDISSLAKEGNTQEENVALLDGEVTVLFPSLDIDKVIKHLTAHDLIVLGPLLGV